MKYVVVSFQNENWEDDPGSHDPILLELPEDIFEKLINTFEERDEEGFRKVLSNDDYESLAHYEIPCDQVSNHKIEWIGTLWYSFE